MATTGDILQEGTAAGPPTRRRRRKVGLAVLGAVAAAIVALVIWSYVGASGYYAISPGTAPLLTTSASCRPAAGGSLALPGGEPCVRIIVPPGQASTVKGSVLMVDVLVGKATPWQYFLSRVGLLHAAENGTVLYSNSEILGTTPASQLGCQNAQEMDQATTDAPVAALRRLGYHVGQTDTGARIFEVVPSSPAAAAGVHCNDLVTAVDGQPVTTSTALADAIRSHRPGSTVQLTVSRPGANGPAQTLRLRARLGGTPAEAGHPADPGQAFLGVASQTATTFDLPVHVSIQVGAIGGPSAGLAMTLGILDTLGHGQLTGGHHIAATGTIDPQGNVGDVSGVAQKAVAVRSAGAEVFFVPVPERAAACSEAGSMKVYAVSSLDQVLSVLKSMGGQVPDAAHLPPAPASACSTGAAAAPG